jgi:hypothetical protein
MTQPAAPKPTPVPAAIKSPSPAVVAPTAETPVVAAPVVVTPAATTPAAVAPTTVTPAVVVPAAVAPVATVRTVAVPAKTQPAAAPVTPRTIPAPAATKSSSPPVKAKPTNEIATVSGAIYKNVYVEKVEPDGIIISYTPSRGGMGMTKVLFDDLSAELRQKYEKKQAYEQK